MTGVLRIWTLHAQTGRHQAVCPGRADGASDGGKAYH